jgi:glycosyltransferase
MTESTLVSIVTPVYNGSQYLEDLIESVLNQDYPRLEHIVIDDGSDDGGATRSILEQYSHLRWWSRENRGQYATQNEAIKAAKGDVFVVVAADDVLASSTAVSSVIDYWRIRPDLDGVYGKTLHVDESLTPLPVRSSTVWRFSPWLMRYYMCISHSALYVRRDWVVSRAIWFDTELHFAGDWEWVSRVVGAGCSLGFLDQDLSLYRLHPAQSTQATGESRLMVEYEQVWRRNGVSPLAGKTVRAAFALHQYALRAAWVGRTQGMTALADVTLDWLSRRAKQTLPRRGPD